MAVQINRRDEAMRMVFRGAELLNISDPALATKILDVLAAHRVDAEPLHVGAATEAPVRKSEREIGYAYGRKDRQANVAKLSEAVALQVYSRSWFDGYQEGYCADPEPCSDGTGATA